MELTQLMRPARSGDTHARDVTVRTVQRLWLKARILLQAAME